MPTIELSQAESASQRPSVRPRPSTRGTGPSCCPLQHVAPQVTEKREHEDQSCKLTFWPLPAVSERTLGPYFRCKINRSQGQEPPWKSSPSSVPGLLEQTTPLWSSGQVHEWPFLTMLWRSICRKAAAWLHVEHDKLLAYDVLFPLTLFNQLHVACSPSQAQCKV